MQGRFMEDLKDRSDEFERFLSDEDLMRERAFNESRAGRWWNAFLARRWAKAMRRLKAMGREE